jgi:hypothetical protein
MAKQIKKPLLVFSGLLLVVLLFLSFWPLPAATLDNCKKYTGMVEEVRTGDGPGDIVIRLKDNNHYYYINRGTDYGVDPEALRQEILNTDIEIFTINHWTPLDPTSNTKHIARLTSGGRILYSEIK